MESGAQVDVCYTDFVKAFSRTNLHILLAKLKAYGFDGSVLKWFGSYLLGRKQIVLIGNYRSKEIIALSGVPEGSHLGPALFLLYINDIVNVIRNCHLLIFADDIKIFKKIKTVGDCCSFQNDLKIFHDWCISNDLLLNFNKCAVMTYNRTLHPIMSDYFLNDIKLLRVFEIKDLGVVFDPKLSFERHVDCVVAKANSLLGFIKRNSANFKDPYTVKSLFCSLVRPVLEYCSIVWFPNTVKNINRIERVQKCFLRFALRNFNLPENFSFGYNSKCLLLGLETLERRRKVYSVMFIRDILCFSIKSDNLLFLINLYAPSRSLRYRELLYVDHHSTLYGQREPISRCVNLLNVVNEDVDIFCMSRETLRNSLRFLNI